MNITILNAAVSTQPAKKPGGKPYQLVEVAYKNNSFNGAVQGKKITSYSKAYQAVVDAQIGQSYDVVTEKNGEFVEWVSLSKAGAVAESAPQTRIQGTAQAVSQQILSPTAAPKGNWETPEERAKKQVYIIRQSSISSAVSTLAAGAKHPPSPELVIDTARKFERYVLATEPLSGFDDIPSLPADFDIDPQVE